MHKLSCMSSNIKKIFVNLLLLLLHSKMLRVSIERLNTSLKTKLKPKKHFTS